MNYLQGSGKILRQIKISYCSFAICAVEGDLLPSPLAGLLRLDNLRVKRCFVVTVRSKPILEIRIARSSIHGYLIFYFDTHRALISRCATGVQRAAEAQLVRAVEARESAVAGKGV